MSYRRYCVSGKRGLRDRFRREGLRLRVLANTEGDSIDGRQDLLVVGRGAAHSNTRGKRNKLRDSSLDCRESIERERGRSQTKDVTWGPWDPQVLPKYEGIKVIALKGTEV